MDNWTFFVPLEVMARANTCLPTSVWPAGWWWESVASKSFPYPRKAQGRFFKMQFLPGLCLKKGAKERRKELCIAKISEYVLLLTPVQSVVLIFKLSQNSLVSISTVSVCKPLYSLKAALGSSWTQCSSPGLHSTEKHRVVEVALQGAGQSVMCIVPSFLIAWCALCWTFWL